MATTTYSLAKKIATAIIALVTWFALGLQLSITVSKITSQGRPLTVAVEFFLHFFTVLSNLIVAISLTAGLLAPATSIGRFFLKPSVQTAIAVYIVTVGLVYNLVLRGIVPQEGFSKLADELLHVIVPLLYLVFWYVFTAPRSLGWKDNWPWLIYPGLYLLYALIRGEILGEYPYPFLNVATFGYGQVVLNAAGVLVAFLVVSYLFIALNRVKR
jgi:hypothetical protein